VPVRKDVAVGSDLLDDLSWRGLIAQSTDLDALRRALDEGTLTLYAGFDPTAPSLHAGNLMPLLTLRRFQQAGHRPIVLGGGATGMIGDPREVGERSMQSVETVSEWTARIRSQLERFVDFDDSPTSAVTVNNLDWTAQLPVLDFLRDVGKHFSVNVMIARETVKARLEGSGISYTEFSYLLLQSMDYLELFRRHGCRLQIGGSDQWGNILGGVDLIRRVEQQSVHALTTPLVTNAAGEKFGKSTGGGSLWLDPAMTSPYAFYQYWINVDDRDAGTYLRYFTFLSREEIEALDAETAERPQARSAQRRLAQELTTLVHGADETERVEAASRALFGRGELDELDPDTLAAALAEAPTAVVEGALPSVADLLALTGLAASKSAARRTVAEGGASVNNQRVDDPDAVPAADDLLHGRWLVLRKGKRNVAGVDVRPGA
jgi:tyrosyl-tRNA synthetase